MFKQNWLIMDYLILSGNTGAVIIARLDSGLAFLKFSLLGSIWISIERSLMTNLNPSLPVHRSQSGTAQASLGFHWLVSALGALMVGGLYLISWAANHAQVDDPFVSPWAIPIYAGFTVFAIVLIGTLFRNRAAGYSGGSALPHGYTLALLGIGLFLCGLIAGIFGQQVFGAPVDIEIFTSPILLLVYLGTLLIVSAPLRAAWISESSVERPGWRSLGPAILSLGLILSTL